jgi:uncharacterized protein YjbI with pentapeptide repeats/energy-coupling factor transporter ATP-binding protein EcfA2
MVVPQRAAVRPRVIAPATGQSILLEDEIASLVDRGASGVIALVGPHGCGKSTALQHLKAVIRRANVELLDEPNANELDTAAGAMFTKFLLQGIVVYARTTPHAVTHLTQYRLASWSVDDVIEYLLGANRDRCAAIMTRFKQATDTTLASGNPELVRIVLDAMLRDDSISGVHDALERFIDEQLPNARVRNAARNYALAHLKQDESQFKLASELLAAGCPEQFMRALRHRPVQVILAGESICEAIRDPEACPELATPFPYPLVGEVASRISRGSPLLERLESIVNGPDQELHANAASILHACDVGWQPVRSRRRIRQWPFRRKLAPWLAGAHFERANWPGARLSYMDFSGAHWNNANLAGADLQRTIARDANLNSCNLRHAKLREFVGNRAWFVAANLSDVVAPGASFLGANLENAVFTNAALSAASFAGANLSGACFRQADLSRANLHQAVVSGTDFSGAKLQEAQLDGLCLRSAECNGANFEGAYLTRCDLEEMCLESARFRGARLDSALLTASVMPGANFHRASLCGAGLAEIDWENADLRGADLRGATFHMGSSRSGKVGSPIASEGTRMGFYTDEYFEQEFKAPEEIRKANLRGADLRGAKIGDVDFYLVDLRGAKYDKNQRQHFRSCRAILQDRV